MRFGPTRRRLMVSALVAMGCAGCAAPLSALGRDDAEDAAFLDGLAQRLFARECGGDLRKLIWWSPREDFPSLGIGHFIWLPAGVDVPFEATFPEMIAWVARRYDEPPPAWAREPHAPWPDRKVFLAESERSSARIEALRQWLWRTRRQQAAFVVDRFERRIRPALVTLPDADRARAMHAWRLLRRHVSGQWAMLDYFNFKGMGDNPRERYQGQGWGLIQVLSAMPSSVRAQTALPTFVEAARYVLHKRIRLAPQDRREARWWVGWAKRVERYLE